MFLMTSNDKTAPPWVLSTKAAKKYPEGLKEEKGKRFKWIHLMHSRLLCREALRSRARAQFDQVHSLDLTDCSFNLLGKH